MGIPMSQHPNRVKQENKRFKQYTPAVDLRGNRIPGRDYQFGNGNVILQHTKGHKYKDDPSQNRGAHYNDRWGNHYDYSKKRRK